MVHYAAGFFAQPPSFPGSIYPPPVPVTHLPGPVQQQSLLGPVLLGPNRYSTSVTSQPQPSTYAVIQPDLPPLPGLTLWTRLLLLISYLRLQLWNNICRFRPWIIQLQQDYMLRSKGRDRRLFWRASTGSGNVVKNYWGSSDTQDKVFMNFDLETFIPSKDIKKERITWIFSIYWVRHYVTVPGWHREFHWDTIEKNVAHTAAKLRRSLEKNRHLF